MRGTCTWLLQQQFPDLTTTVETFQLLVDAKRNIAKWVGRAQAHVFRRLSLLRLPAEVLADLETGKLPIKDAEKLGGVPEESLPDVGREARHRGVDYAVNRYHASTGERSRSLLPTEGVKSVTARGATDHHGTR